MDPTKTKDRWELVPFDALRQIVGVFTAGAKKYNDFGWMTVENGVDVYFSAAMRHLTKWRTGEHMDPDGFSHLAHAATNLIIAMSLVDAANAKQGGGGHDA